jgi:membrane-associated phospholipid phosphatase
LFAFAVSVAAIVVCVFYVDRTVADFFDTHVRHIELWHYLDRFLKPFLFVLVAALFFLLAAGGWILSGRKLPAWTRTPLLCSWSAMWGLAAETIFKGMSGRSWPDPAYVRNHLYGFHFLQGDPRASAFPSGHAIIATAIVTVLWIRIPRLRILSVLVALAVVTVLVVNNFHWVSDVIAGAYLGVSIGWMTVRLLHPAFPADPDATPAGQ